MRQTQPSESCALCACRVHRLGDYALPTVKGRSHATRHHFVAERFFGRSTNRAGEQREPIFESCPWEIEGLTAVYCYECHEELLHNPVFTPEDISAFARLIEQRGLSEREKSESRTKLAGRVRLLHEIIQRGIATLSAEEGL